MSQALLERPQPPAQPPAAGSLERRVTLALVVLPFVGFVTAIVLLWRQGISGLDLGLMGALYVISGLGVTVGYHRLFTHRSFTAGPRTRAVLAVMAGLAVQGSVISWVADHRKHHAFSDREGDPHSPHLEDVEGFWGVLRGLWHAHTGWLFRGPEERTDRSRYAPDLFSEPALVVIDRLFPVLTLVSFVLPAAIGGLVTGSWWGAFTGALWGGAVRVFFLHHVTWSINSICHFYGRRPYESRDMSTNNWLLSLVSFGESWHNNHHAFPTAAVHGIERWQIDLTGLTIRMMEALGLASSVKRVSEEQKARKRAA